MLNFSRSLVFVALLFGGSSFANPNIISSKSDKKPTLKQKIGQLFILGFIGDRPDDRFQSLIDEWRPGGFILFRRNITSLLQVRALNQNLRMRSTNSLGQGPFLAVDQEGGVVTRIPTFPLLPSQHVLGKTNDPQLANELAQIKGAQLRRLGFNMNLAPVLDLSNPKMQSFINSRSYGESGETAGLLGTSYGRGLLAQGILPTAKHFPGMGSTVSDVHQQQVAFEIKEDNFQKTHMAPFREFSKIGFSSAMMISQMKYDFIDPTHSAPFSNIVLKGLLRDSVKFQGLVITDDLQMRGSADIYSPYQAAVETLKAGADMVMITWSVNDQLRAMNQVLRAVRSGEISRADLDAKIERIQRVKQFLEEMNTQHGRRLASLPKVELKDLDTEILKRNLQGELPVLKDWAIKTNSEDICAVSSNKQFLKSIQTVPGFGVRSIYVRSAVEPSELAKALKNCRRPVFAIQGKSLAATVKKLIVDYSVEKALIVNMGMPNLALGISNVAVVNIGFPHLQTGYEIGKEISDVRLNGNLGHKSQQ